jgi:hypothetical protein
METDYSEYFTALLNSKVVDHMRYAVQMEKGNSKLAEVSTIDNFELS